MIAPAKSGSYRNPIINIDVVAATGCTIRSKVQSVLRRTFSLLSRDHILSLTDQAVVSGAGFVTTFLIARWGGSSELGVYSLSLSVLLSVVGFQESLIVQPYLIQKYYPEGTRAERAGASLTLSLLFSAASILVLSAAAFGFSGFRAVPEMAAMSWALGGVLPFALTRDFTRRFSFAHFDTTRVILLDLASAMIQLSILGWLAASGRMTALNACAALGAAAALPSAVWFYFARADFAFRSAHLRTTLRQTWALGKWLLAGRITVQLQGYVTYWVAAAIGGAAFTGVYAACMSLVGFANPLMIGLTNIVMPRSVLAWRQGGGPGLWRESIQNTALIGAVMAAFVLGVFFGGDPLMRLVFHGKEFEGYGQTLIVLAVATAIGALGTPASIALATMERPRAIVIVTTFETILTVALVWSLMTGWGLLGGAIGMLVGNLAGTVGRWIALYLRVPEACASALVGLVLQDFTKSSDADWTFRRIAGNDDAEVFLVESKYAHPIRGQYRSIVVKLFKIEVPSVSEVMQAQMSLHRAMDGRVINGWTISVPQPLHVGTTPPALVMTTVPGQSIGSYTSDTLAPNILRDAAYTFAMTMDLLWSSGRGHGDLNFENVLFDIDAKSISLLDAGTRGDCRVCNDREDTSAKVCDLAHMLWEAGHDVMDLIRGKTRRLSNELFVENILLTIIGRIDSHEDRIRLLNAIWNCAQLHLSDKLALSWSVQGAWNFLINRIAKRRVRSILGRVRCHPDFVRGENGSKHFGHGCATQPAIV